MKFIPWINSSININLFQLLNIKKILKSGNLTNNGKFNQKLENEIHKYYPFHNVITCNSGSQALFLTIKALQLQGKVILPSFTYLATLSAIVENNLDFTFADADSHTWTIDCDYIENLLAQDNSYSAVIAVNVFGNSPNLQQLKSACKKYNCVLIIDDSHGFGVNPVPQQADDTIRCISLHATKGFSAIEGGLCLIPNDTLAKNIRQLKDHGLAKNRIESQTGFNGRLDEIRSYIALINLSKFKKNQLRREVMAKYYQQQLVPINNSIRFQKNAINSKRVYTNFAVLFDCKNLIQYSKKDKFITQMRSHNINVRRYFHPVLHLMQNFTISNSLTTTENLSKNLYSLPFYIGLTNKQISYICQNIITYVQECDNVG